MQSGEGAPQTRGIWSSLLPGSGPENLLTVAEVSLSVTDVI